MPEMRQTVKLFIASSNELADEREKIVVLLSDINKHFPHLYLEPVKWDTDLESGSYGQRVQDVINPLLDQSDIVVFLFYSRAGVFTLEEYQRTQRLGKKTFVYFKSGFSPQNRAEFQQYDGVLAIKEALEQENTGLYRSFQTIAELENALRKDLDLYLRKQFPPAGKKSEQEQQRQQQDSRSASGRPKFSLYHQYTCDRSPQVGQFIRKQTGKGARKVHFFYLYGGERQAHVGIFRRFVGRLKGADLDYLNPKRSAGFDVLDFSVVMARVEDLSFLGTELPRMLMAEMIISEKDMEAVAEKNLAFALKKSPMLSGLGASDKICVHLIVSEMIWDKTLLPAAMRGFIESFCLNGLPANAPEIFFFFSIQYEDEDQRICKEVKVALQDATYMESLGELTMVTETDIKAWFSTYQQFWETASRRHAWREEHFGAQTPDMYMEEVQEILEMIIKKINDSEKDANRNP